MVLFLVGVLIILHESVDAMTRLANISSLTPPLSLTISVMINFEYYNEDDYNDMKFMCFYFLLCFAMLLMCLNYVFAVYRCVFTFIPKSEMIFYFRFLAMTQTKT